MSLNSQQHEQSPVTKILPMTDANHARISPALVEAVAGLSAGSIATLVVHPLDIVKTRMQIHRSSLAPSQQKPQRPGPSSLAVLRSLAASDQPVRSLYRGLTPNLLGNATSWAAFFWFKAHAENGIAALRGGGGWRPGPEDATAPRLPRGSAAAPDAKATLRPADFFVASFLAGCATQALTNPIWVLKTRMLSTARTDPGAYRSLRRGAASLYAAEGWRGFYRGLAVSMVGPAHGAVQFAVYEPAKRAYLAYLGRKQQQQAAVQGGRPVSPAAAAAPQLLPPPPHMANEATVVLSTLAKLAANAVTYPYQVVRSRVQAHEAEARFGSGVRGVVTTLWREEGWRGFYRGLAPGLVRFLPSTWVTFLVYENVKTYLPGLVEGLGDGR